jgi:hypothetical protein
LIAFILFKTKKSNDQLKKAQLNESIKLLDDYKNGKLGPNVTDQQLWDAQKIKQVIFKNMQSSKFN